MRLLAIALVALLCAAVVAPPAAAHTINEETVFLTSDDGNAYVIYTVSYDLTNETGQQNFNEISASTESEQEYRDEFVNRLQSSADVEHDTTPNSFNNARVNTEEDTDSQTGIVTVELIWEGFATSVGNDSITVDSPLDSSFETGTQTYLYAPQDKTFTESSTVDGAEVQPEFIYWAESTTLDGIELTTEPSPDTNSEENNTDENNTDTDTDPVAEGGIDNPDGGTDSSADNDDLSLVDLGVVISLALLAVAAAAAVRYQ